MKIRRLPPSPRPPPDRRPPPAHLWLQLGLPLLGGLFVLALIADLALVGRRAGPGVLFPDVPAEIQGLRTGLNGPRYTAPNGLFSIVAPRGWTIRSGDDSAPYDVTFRSPNGISINLMATPVPYDDLPALYADIDRREREFGIHADIETIYFQKKPAARRVVKLLKSKVIAIDFMADRVAHHLLCEIPTDYFDRYQPVLMDLLQTYRTFPPRKPAGGK